MNTHASSTVARPDLGLRAPSLALSAPLGALRALLREWRHRSRSRRELAELDEHLLKDVGITRDQARTEIDKPFWRV